MNRLSDLAPPRPAPAARPAPSSWHRIWPGLLACLALAGAALEAGRLPWMAAHGLSPLTVAMVLGMLAGNTLYPRWAATAGPGVSLAKQTLLRAGIVLYGLRLTLQDIGQVGLAGVVIDALMLISTFTLACVIGRRLLGLDRDTCVLIGAGSAICGAAAVMATEPVLEARSEKVAVAMSTVVVFGTLSIFIYPALWRLGLPHLPDLPHAAHAYGVYTGATVHEVAQVVAAAQAAGPEAAGTAVIAKMVRVMMLAPFLVGLSLWQGRSGAPLAPRGARLPVRGLPWFALLFIGVVIAQSIWPLSAGIRHMADLADTVLLAMAMAALGLTTHLSAVRQAGVRPLWLGAMLYGWLVIGGALINRAVMALA